MPHAAGIRSPLFNTTLCNAPRGANSSLPLPQQPTTTWAPCGRYDHSVRDYNNKIVQFRYNGWGLDPKYQVRVDGEARPQFADLRAVFGV